MVTTTRVRQILKSLKMPRYYNNVHLVRYLLCGHRPPQMTEQQENEIMALFNDIVKLYDHLKSATQLYGRTCFPLVRIAKGTGIAWIWRVFSTTHTAETPRTFSRARTYLEINLRRKQNACSEIHVSSNYSFHKHPVWEFNQYWRNCRRVDNVILGRPFHNVQQRENVKSQKGC